MRSELLAYGIMTFSFRYRSVLTNIKYQSLLLNKNSTHIDLSVYVSPKERESHKLNSDNVYLCIHISANYVMINIFASLKR